MLSLRFHALVPLALSACLAPAWSAGASPTPDRPAQFILGGDLDQSGPVTLSQLRSLPAARQPAGGARAQVGASLWSVLDRAGIRVDASRRNDLLNRYVLVTGADGRKVVFSLGELSPHFGNRQGLVAYAESVDGVLAQPPGAAGLQVLATGDVQAGRRVAWPARIDVRTSASTVPEQGDVVSNAVRVSGAVRRPGTFDLAALKALPAVTRTVGADIYVGASLWHLLDTTLGLAAGQPLGMYVVASGSDGQKAVVSIGEIDPAAGNQPVLVAYQVNGVPIDVDGFARLVVPNDSRKSRHVSSLMALEVFVARP